LRREGSPRSFELDVEEFGHANHRLCVEVETSRSFSPYVEHLPIRPIAKDDAIIEDAT